MSIPSEHDTDVRLNRRIVTAGIAGGVLFSGLAARLAQLQLLEGQKYQKIADENGVKLELAPPLRGNIVDRFGQPLASHRQAGRVSIVREQTPDIAASLREVARHIDLSPEKQARIAQQARPGIIQRQACQVGAMREAPAD